MFELPHHQCSPTHPRCLRVPLQDKEPERLQLLCHPSGEGHGVCGCVVVKVWWSVYHAHQNTHNYILNCALHLVRDLILFRLSVKRSLTFLPPHPLQTMAIATLALCYNNPNVFTGVVKIRKGQAVDLIMQSTNMKSIESIFSLFVDEVGACAF